MTSCWNFSRVTPSMNCWVVRLDPAFLQMLSTWGSMTLVSTSATVPYSLTIRGTSSGKMPHTTVKSRCICLPSARGKDTPVPSLARTVSLPSMVTRSTSVLMSHTR